MQYAFLEKLSSDGIISEQDKARIYGTCSDIMTKVAFKWKNPFRKDDFPTLGEALKEQGAHLLTRFILPAGAVGAVAWGSNKGFTEMASNAEASKILKVKADLLSKPEFAADRAKAEARFDELAKISPKAAAKPEWALRLVKGSLHSGFTRDEVQRLAQLQATYERPTFTASSASEDVQRALLRKTAADAGKIAASVVAILAEAGLGEMNKTAAIPWKTTPLQKATSIAKQVLTTGAIVSGFGALVGLGAGATNQALHYMKRKESEKKLKESFYEAMRRSDPNREALHANKDKALQAFQTLTHFAPHVAADPEAARAFMINLLSMDQGVLVGAIKDLSEIEKNLKASKGGNPFFEGMQAGTSAVGLQGALGSATGKMLEPFVMHSAAEIRKEMGY
jgi:hypothetical protein